MISRKIFYIKTVIVLLILGGFIFYGANPILLKIRSKVISFFAPVYKINWKWWGKNDNSILLQEKERAIKALQFDLDVLHRENSSLKESLNLKTKSKFSSLKGSKVIFYSRDLGRDFLIIDLGDKEGVEVGNIVIDSKGVLVGVVQESNEDFSKVDMAYNPGRSFEAEIKSSGLRVLAEGAGSGEWYLKLIPPDTELKTNDLVSLVGGQFKSILLGEISETGYGDIFVESKARALFFPEHLDNVFVISQPK
ncbi:MAG: rod shape-determining protein MreC [bacterium]|nr:rod shape-determining protein MreC [bacterium]